MVSTLDSRLNSMGSGTLQMKTETRDMKYYQSSFHRCNEEF